MSYQQIKTNSVGDSQEHAAQIQTLWAYDDTSLRHSDLFDDDELWAMVDDADDSSDASQECETKEEWQKPLVGPTLPTPTGVAFYPGKTLQRVTLKSDWQCYVRGWRFKESIKDKPTTDKDVIRKLHALYRDSPKFAFNTPDERLPTMLERYLSAYSPRTEVYFDTTTGRFLPSRRYMMFVFMNKLNGSLIVLPESLLFQLQEGDRKLSEEFEQMILNGVAVDESIFAFHPIEHGTEYADLLDVDFSFDEDISKQELVQMADEIAVDDFESGERKYYNFTSLVSPTWVNFSDKFEDGSYVLQQFKLPVNADSSVYRTLIARQSMHHLALAHMHHGFTMLHRAARNNREVTEGLRSFILDDDYRTEFNNLVFRHEGEKNHPQILKDRADRYFPIDKNKLY